MSPRTSRFLAERFSFDAVSLIARGEGHLTDQEVAETAIGERRVPLTFDLDFGEIFHRKAHPTLGIIILRLTDERSPAVNQVLERFFEEQSDPSEFEGSLTIVSEFRVRRRTTR
jgi:predicted nuclease of predicted toxin-antitoxin system